MHPELRSAKFILWVLSCCLCCLVTGCNYNNIDTDKEIKAINNMLDSWHKAASKADFDAYFKYFDEDGVFMGTDASEYWPKKDFMLWAKPIFDKGKAWDFKALERHVYIDKSGNIAWFDELLKTQMKLCRGSGVLRKTGYSWKIQQYVLSMTIPNANTDTVVRLKAPIEDSIINTLLQKQH